MGPASLQGQPGRCVLVLHGLARTRYSMQPLARYLAAHGYQVENVGYPSRRLPIETLAREVLPRALARCRRLAPTRIHVVTHSLGGILVRAYLAEQAVPELGRVVMLSPPNQGSEVVDRLRGLPGFGLYNGPAGLQLGTGPDSVPRGLGPVDFPLGIITGDRCADPLLSRLLPKPNDGKVSVASARVEGMQDFLVVPYGHTTIMRQLPVMEQVLAFLGTGRFVR
jgi:triacylglycerol lipase